MQNMSIISHPCRLCTIVALLHGIVTVEEQLVPDELELDGKTLAEHAESTSQAASRTSGRKIE